MPSNIFFENSIIDMFTYIIIVHYLFMLSILFGDMLHITVYVIYSVQMYLLTVNSHLYSTMFFCIFNYRNKIMNKFYCLNNPIMY